MSTRGRRQRGALTAVVCAALLTAGIAAVVRLDRTEPVEVSAGGQAAPVPPPPANTPAPPPSTSTSAPTSASATTAPPSTTTTTTARPASASTTTRPST
ncbi:MAG: hypothetical protein M3357_18615, partial [Actinomycetota bacterium]|nr:hypothetical protein [Actinomycetota bacterium]